MFAKIFNEMGKWWKPVKWCALRDKRVHASDKLNVNKQLKQTKNSLKLFLSCLSSYSYRTFFNDKDIAAINLLNV